MMRRREYHYLMVFLVLCGVIVWAVFYKTPRLGIELPLESEEQLALADPIWKQLEELRKGFEKSEFPTIAVIDSGAQMELLEREGVSQIGEKGGDDLGHGTGLILQLAAKRNQFGVVGYVPEARIISIKLGNAKDLNSGNIALETWEEALIQAKNAGAKIVVLCNSNIIERWPLENVKNILMRHENDFLVIVSAGNDGLNLSYGDKCKFSPICVNAPNLIKVGASDYSRSNRGEVVDISIASIVFVWRRDFGKATESFEIRSSKSTSVAVPKVAAIAALLWTSNLNKTPAEIKRSITHLLNH